MVKKLLTAILAIGLLCGLMAGPAMADMKDMWAYVYTWDGTMQADGTLKLTRQTENITFCVFPRDQIATVETLYEYNDNAFTALTNPVTGTNFTSATVCNDMISFRVDPADATYDRYVDLLVVDQDGGFTTFIEDFDEYTHAIIIDERKNIQHHGAIWFYSTTAGELDTGIDFLDNAVIRTVAIEVLIADADETIDVGLLGAGTDGDADGFIDGQGLDTVAYYDVKKHNNTTYGLSSGVSHFHIVDNPLGALLGTFVIGSGGDTQVGYHGIIQEWDFIPHATQEQSLTWTITDCSTAWGLIHYYFTVIR
jgi:hypothetical protein